MHLNVIKYLNQYNYEQNLHYDCTKMCKDNTLQTATFLTDLIPHGLHFTWRTPHEEEEEEEKEGVHTSATV